MIKRIAIAIFGLLIVVGVLAGIKGMQIRKMIASGGEFSLPPETVTASEVIAESWESVISSIGSLEAVQGVTITAEVPGRITEIAFEPGGHARAGDLLVRLDSSIERAQLRSAEAAAALAEADFARIKDVEASGGIARSDYDSAEARCKDTKAQVDVIRAAIAKKNIRAPFAGYLGIRLINLGQVLNEGDAVVSLQALNPIFVNFYLPQQQLSAVEEGFEVRLSIDGQNMENRQPDSITGKITTINPDIDSTTRNFLVQATVANRDERLRPGMFANVAVVMPRKKDVLAIPATAVLYAPYGDSVFVVEAKEDASADEGVMVLRQQFVRLGEKQGDYVAVLSGLKAGEKVVTTGVFKLRNGLEAVVDNSLVPEFSKEPKPPNT